MPRGFEWFVAWRYLRTAPRGGRIAFTLAAWLGGTGVYAFVRALAEEAPAVGQVTRRSIFGRPLPEVILELAAASAVALGVALLLIGMPVWRASRRGLAADVIRNVLLVTLVGVGVWALVQGASAALPSDPLVPLIEWKTLFKFVGHGGLVLASWCFVFGFIKRRQTFFTTISTFGVFLGAWALIVALSVMNGFEADLRQKILGSNAHVRITHEDGAFAGWQAVAEKARNVPGVVGLTPYVATEVVLAPKNGTNFAGVIIKGVDPQTISEVSDLRENLQRGATLERLWPIGPDGGALMYTSIDDGGPIDTVDAGAGGAGEGADGGVDDGYVPPIFDGDGDGGGDSDSDAAASAGATKPDDYVPPIFDGDDGATTADDEVPAGADTGLPTVRVRPRAPDSFPGPAEPGGLPEFAPELLDLDIGLPAPHVSKPASRRPIEPTPGVAELDGMLVGQELTSNLHLWVGQEVHVVSPLATDLTGSGEKPRLRNFRIAGVFFTGMYEYDSKTAYVSLPALQRFLSLGDSIDGIEIKILDRDETGPVVQALVASLGKGWIVEDWKEINRSLFAALKLEKIAMFLVLTIIILVASFSIVSNLIMIVVEKAREVAILKAQGASNGGVRRVFMFEGLYIGLLGAGLGLVFGVGTCVLFQTVGIPVPADVYYIDRLPVNMDPIAIGLVAVACVAISFLATVYPASIAARLSPVDGLRHD